MMWTIADVGGEVLGQFNQLEEGDIVGIFGGRNLFISCTRSGRAAPSGMCVGAKCARAPSIGATRFFQKSFLPPRVSFAKFPQRFGLLENDRPKSAVRSGGIHETDVQAGG